MSPGNPTALLELALADQEARHATAMAAIRARSDDINEAQRLVTALTARCFTIRAIVDCHPFLTPTACRIRLWCTTTPDEFKRLRGWLSQSDIDVARLEHADAAEVQAYEVTLRGQKLRLNVTFRDPRASPTTARLHPEAA